MKTSPACRPDPAFWIDRPVLVTGATGLLGGWLLRRLIESKAEAVCIVRDWVPQCEAAQSGVLSQARVVRGNVTDRSLIERVLGEYEIDTVFHLAAQTLVPVANRNPVSTFETNIGGTWSMLESCRRSSMVRCVVVTSSDKSYGEHVKLPYEESFALEGRNPYDASKSCTDILALSYAHTFGVPLAVTRCGNLYGGGDLNWNRIIPGTIRSVIRGRRPVIRSDGKFVRDYFHVEDAVDALLILSEKILEPKLASRVIGNAFNFSNEEPLTVIQLVQKILKLMGSPLKPVVENRAVNEIRRQYLSARKARQILGWSPQLTLDEGLKRTIDWYQTFFED